MNELLKTEAIKFVTQYGESDSSLTWSIKSL